MSPTGRSRIWFVAALGAFAFLSWLTLGGSRPVMRQLIKTETKGMLSVAPETIDHVVIASSAGERRYSRSSGGWRDDIRKRQLDAADAHRLEIAVKILRTSPPVRAMTPAEVGSAPLSDFGLDPPKAVVTLYDHSTERMRLDLGKSNPQSMLRYARVNGTPGVLIYSGFVGEEWETVAGLAPPVVR